MDYVVETIVKTFRRNEELRGMRITYQAPFLRHFTVRLEPVDVGAPVSPAAKERTR